MHPKCNTILKIIFKKLNVKINTINIMSKNMSIADMYNFFLKNNKIFTYLILNLNT